MTVEIKNRYTGEVIATGETLKEAAEKSRANLSWAKLSWANLSGANLSRADLSEADLSGANLSEADLPGANLSRADLSEADLSRADLSWADLSWAKLSWAKLSWANLSGADLSRADLSEADLLRADLSRAKHRLHIPVIPDIHRVIYEAASQPDALDMGSWHKCETTHCRAGWTIVKAGEAGKVLESVYGPNVAAALIYAASDPSLDRVPDWSASNEDAMADMKRLAGVE